MAITVANGAIWSGLRFRISALLFTSVTIAWLVYAYSTWFALERPFEPRPPLAIDSLRCPSESRRVAIIGAGSGGASTAFYLRQAYPCPLSVTVYEREGYTGGRSTTVRVYGDIGKNVEVGASIFVDVNRNLVSAVKRFNLSVADYDGEDFDGLTPSLGIWNGKAFVLMQNEDSHEWWNSIRMFWKYGMSTVRTQRLVKANMEKFLKMYDAPIFPFTSISKAALDAGLSGWSETSEKLFEENGIYAPFSSDIIQAATRVNYAQNLAQIHGLEATVCMAAGGAMSVHGGNWQIFDRMLRHDNNEILLNTRVIDVSHADDAGHYRVKSISSIGDGQENSTSTKTRTFDTIVVAGPLQYANITFKPPLAFPPRPIPYVTLYVTLFTSPYRLSPSRFGLQDSKDVPTTILTTLSADDGPPPSFFSLSTLRKVTNPHTQPAQTEYLYKLFSPAPPSTDDLLAMLQVPDDFWTSAPANDSFISWKYDKMWHSYPYLPPRVSFDNPQLDEKGGLWYTSGIEPFISTMETSSLMGKNIAQLIVDRWLAGQKVSRSKQ